MSLTAGVYRIFDSRGGWCPILRATSGTLPTLWALIATQARLQLGVREDIGLSVAALVAVALSIGRRNRPAPSRPRAAEVPNTGVLGR